MAKRAAVGSQGRLHIGILIMQIGGRLHLKIACIHLFEATLSYHRGVITRLLGFLACQGLLLVPHGLHGLHGLLLLVIQDLFLVRRVNRSMIGGPSDAGHAAPHVRPFAIG